MCRLPDPFLLITSLHYFITKWHKYFLISTYDRSKWMASSNVIALFLWDNYNGRKKLISSSVGLCLCMNVEDYLYDSSLLTSVSYVVVWLFLCCFEVNLWPVKFVETRENFVSSFVSVCLGLVYQKQRART